MGFDLDYLVSLPLPAAPHGVRARFYKICMSP
jgi:hypothetical protein